VSAPHPELSVLIVNFNSGPHLKICLQSLAAQSGPERELIVVDNASTDSSLLEARDALAGARLIRMGANFGFAAAMNRAAHDATGEWLLLLNPDCVLPEGALQQAIAEAMLEPNLGIAGALVLNPDGSVQRGTWRRMPTPWRLLMSQSGLSRWQERFPLLAGVELYEAQPVGALVQAVNGAFMLLRRDMFEAVGGFDDGYFLHFEDLDLMARVTRAGADVVLLADVKVIHIKGAAGASKFAVEWAKARSMARFFARWQRAKWGARFVPMLACVRVALLAPWWWLSQRRLR